MLLDEMAEECPKSKMYNGTTESTKEREDAASTRQNEKSSSRFSGQPVIWKNVLIIVTLHLLAIYCFVTFPYRQRFKTALFAWCTYACAGIGVAAGAHRLWSHRSYKAKTPFKILLFIFYNTAGIGSLYNWVKEHRVHHKYSDTNADPHNSTRGFFYSHMGWMMVPRHPEFIKRSSQVDMSDILDDPLLAFGEKYFSLLKLLFALIIPVLVPVFFWNEDWYYAIVSQWIMRYCYGLNSLWTVNSVAHIFGWRPYDKTIKATENLLVSYLTFGEGWHNYHHVFPWDYKTAEIGHPFIDLSTYLIEAAAAIGWAYDLKQPSEDLVRRTVARKATGTHVEVPAPSEEIKATT